MDIVTLAITLCVLFGIIWLVTTSVIAEPGKTFMVIILFVVLLAALAKMLGVW